MFALTQFFPAHRARHTARALDRRLGFLLVLLLSLVAETGQLLAFPSDVTFDRADPFDGSALLVARTAADNPLNDPTFQLKADLYFDNAGFGDQTVTFVQFDYPGSGIPSRTYTPQAFDSDGNALLFDLPAGDEGRVPIYDGLGRDLPLPLPATVVIRVFVGFDPDPLVLTFDLKLHENDVPLGAYFFPARASDLEPGEVWDFRTRHTVDAGGGSALNPSTRTQRYALDMGVVRWTGSGWSSLVDGTDGSENDDFLVWNKPLYAMHDGVIVACYRGEVDHDPAPFDEITFDNGFGNSLEILHGGETIKIAHMRFGWPTPDLCPDPGLNDGLSIPVQAGQLLGRVGNTGRSTNAHIHFQAERAPGIGTGTVTGVPMQFFNVRALGTASSINDLGGSPALRALHGATFHRHSLLLPNPCGWEMPPAGAIEVARHGVHADCYQDVFNLIAARGYRPVWVDGYDVSGQTFFNAIFRPAGPANVAFHGLSGADYQAQFADLTADGFRLHQIDSYLDGGDVRYAAIFEQRPGPPWAALHGFDDAQYSAELDALADAGFLPVNVSTVEWNGDLYWTALFEQVPVTGWTVYSVPAADYQSVFDDNVAAGRDPITVHGFDTSFGPFLSAVFVDPMHDDWSAAHGLTAAGYQAAWEANTSAGRWTRAVTGYQDGGSAAFAAIWRGRADTAIDSGPQLVTNQTGAAFELSSDDPFATFECRLDAGAFATCSSSPTLDSLTEGEHTFAARARDRQSLRDVSPATYTWLVDLTPPEVDVVFPGPNTKIVHGVTKEDFVETPTIIGWGSIVATASDALSGLASVGFSVNGAPVPGSEVVHDPVAGTWSYELHPDHNGEHLYSIEVTATDNAGNSASDSIQIVGVKTGKKQP